MKKSALVFGAVVVLVFLCGIRDIRAENVLSSDSGLKEETQEVRENAGQAKDEERQLQQQIDEALAAGDIQTANQLKLQLKTLHAENLVEDELRSEVKEAREKSLTLPRKDNDDNPAGPLGGQ